MTTHRELFVCGVSNGKRSVVLYHTNKWRTNFHAGVCEEVEKVFNSTLGPGTYIFNEGLQNGYGKIGHAVLVVNQRTYEARIDDR